MVTDPLDLPVAAAEEAGTIVRADIAATLIAAPRYESIFFTGLILGVEPKRAAAMASHALVSTRKWRSFGESDMSGHTGLGLLRRYLGQTFLRRRKWLRIDPIVPAGRRVDGLGSAPRA